MHIDRLEEIEKKVRIGKIETTHNKKSANE